MPRVDEKFKPKQKQKRTYKDKPSRGRSEDKYYNGR